jgi:hypothetical protein
MTVQLDARASEVPVSVGVLTRHQNAEVRIRILRFALAVWTDDGLTTEMQGNQETKI